MREQNASEPPARQYFEHTKLDDLILNANGAATIGSVRGQEQSRDNGEL